MSFGTVLSAFLLFSFPFPTLLDLCSNQDCSCFILMLCCVPKAVCASPLPDAEFLFHDGCTAVAKD